MLDIVVQNTKRTVLPSTVSDLASKEKRLMNSHYPCQCLSRVSQITSPNLFLSLLANSCQISLRQQ